MFEGDFTLKGLEANLKATMTIFNIFCEASRIRINWKKSIKIWIPKNLQDLKWHSKLEMT